MCVPVPGSMHDVGCVVSRLASTGVYIVMDEYIKMFRQEYIVEHIVPCMVPGTQHHGSSRTQHHDHIHPILLPPPAAATT